MSDDRSPLDLPPLSRDPTLSWTCGKYNADLAKKRDAEEWARIEAVMILARCMKDQYGHRVAFRIPVALATAISDILSSKENPRKLAMAIFRSTEE